MHQLTPAVGDEHQKYSFERQCRDGQQIGGPEMMSMVAQGTCAMSESVSVLVLASDKVESSDC